MNSDNINVVLFLQIEDAMLMFDKQTNRHRGKHIVINNLF